MDNKAVGKGRLRRVLTDACEENSCSMASLTVLSARVDPYALDTPAHHRDAQWLLKQIERFIKPGAKIYWRGLHYALIDKEIAKPNGKIYRNTVIDAVWLNRVAKPLKWLGYIDWDRIEDHRNDAPIIHRVEAVEPHAWISCGLDITVPDLDDIEPHVQVTGFIPRQAYRLVIFGEKTSLEEVLAPIAERFSADLYLNSGEMSDTHLHEIAESGESDGRRTIVFVVADCDPSGYQMGVSISHKLRALRDFKFPKFEFGVLAPALTVEQVKELGLPATPLKKGEMRKARWLEQHGVEQTEIDALLTLRPDALEEIMVEAIEPYFDTTLWTRTFTARKEWVESAQEDLDDQTGPAVRVELRENLADSIEEIRAAIEAADDEAEMAVPEGVELPPILVPQAEVKVMCTQGFISSSDMTYAEAARALIKRKKYEDADS